MLCATSNNGFYASGGSHDGYPVGLRGSWNSYLLGATETSGQQLDEILNQEAGLPGISGISSDMRKSLAATKKGHERAKLALDIYVHRLRSGIGAMIAVLGGVDALVFTAGVGEHSPDVRAAVCEKFAFLD